MFAQARLTSSQAKLLLQTMRNVLKSLLNARQAILQLSNLLFLLFQKSPRAVKPRNTNWCSTTCALDENLFEARTVWLSRDSFPPSAITFYAD